MDKQVWGFKGFSLAESVGVRFKGLGFEWLPVSERVELGYVRACAFICWLLQI